MGGRSHRPFSQRQKSRNETRSEKPMAEQNASKCVCVCVCVCASGFYDRKDERTKVRRYPHQEYRPPCRPGFSPLSASAMANISSWLKDCGQRKRERAIVARVSMAINNVKEGQGRLRGRQ